MELVVKSADESVSSSATLQDDDHLTFAVGANEEWQFEIYLLVEEGSGGGADIKYTITAPTGSAGGFQHVRNVNDGDDGGDIGTAVTQVLTAGDRELIRIWGAVATGGSSGNVTLQWAQGSSSTNSTTVHAGSYMKYQQAG